MSLSRKHYCAVAAIIASDRASNNVSKDYQQALVGTANKMADYFAADNPNFDRARFLAACKVQS